MSGIAEARLQEFNDYIRSGKFDFETGRARFQVLQQELAGSTSQLVIQQLANYVEMFSQPVDALENVEHIGNGFVPGTICDLSGDEIGAADYITISNGAEPKAFDANHLLRGILSQSAIQNPLNRVPLTDSDIANLCRHFGIDQLAFENLWAQSREDLQVELQSQALINGNDEEAQLALLEGQDVAGEHSNFEIDSRNRRCLGLMQEGDPVKLVRYVAAFEFSEQMTDRFDIGARVVVGAPVNLVAPPVPVRHFQLVEVREPSLFESIREAATPRNLMFVASFAVALIAMHYFGG